MAVMEVAGGPPFQGYRRKAFVKIVVDGTDVTDRVEPFLISVQVNQRERGSDTFSIELDDRDAKLAIPQDGGSVQIYLGWDPIGPRILPTPVVPDKPEELGWEGGMFLLFSGVISTVMSGFSRRGGRRLWVEGKGQSDLAKGKTPDEKHSNIQNMTLLEWMQYIARADGYDVKIDPSLASIPRRSWHKNESFLQYGPRIANEVGGIFKVIGTTAYITSALNNNTAMGEPIGTLYAYAGINMISWRIRPFIGKPQFKQARATMYDNWFAEYKDLFGSIPGSTPFGKSEATTSLPSRVPYAGIGDQSNVGQGFNSQSQRGRGWVLMNGEPLAKCGAQIVIQGARPGVDGIYTVEEAEHTYSRGGGYVTRCELRNPLVGDSGYEYWRQVVRPTPGSTANDVAGVQSGMVAPPPQTTLPQTTTDEDSQRINSGIEYPAEQGGTVTK
jgi:hypothetical protein